MKLNAYQKIIKDGELIQKGEMDTPVKFEQLTQGIDLDGKTVLDVGCNLGAMCNIATAEGARTVGMDINREYIEQARSVFPDLDFRCLSAELIHGNYDIIIASAMLHYVRDLDVVFKSFARCSKQVLCDIWLNDSPDSVFTLSHRNIFIPSRSAFFHIVGKYFDTIEGKGIAITPDKSKRYVFHLSDPVPDPAEAILIYGKGATGKTTLSKTYFNHMLIPTDDITAGWYTCKYNNTQSVKWIIEQSIGDHASVYVEYFTHILKGRLIRCVNRDVVIEGFVLTFDDIRTLIIEDLKSRGWKVSLIETKNRYSKEYP